MTEPTEVELKLEFAAADHAALRALAPFAGIAGERGLLVSVYFDTPDQALRRAGYTLRIRHDGDRRIQTIKAEEAAAAGLFVRPEWEREITGEAPQIDARGGPLAGLLGAAGIARLRPCFATDVRRETLLLADGAARIACAIDLGVAHAGAATEPLCELELELTAGDPRALFDLARRIDGEVPLRLGVRSKAERGYRLADAAAANMGDGAGAGQEAAKTAFKADPILLDPAAGIGAAFATIAHGCIRQFRLNEALLLADGADAGGGAEGADGGATTGAVHQARVGLRRLRSAFTLFAPLLAEDPAARPLAQELRWLAGTLALVRNIDVLIPRIDAAWHAPLHAARAEAMARARTDLRSARARRLMLDLAEWLAIGAWRGQPGDAGTLAPDDITRFAADLLDKRRRRLKRRSRQLAGQDDAQRHCVRIEAKKLRYAAEFFASLFPGKKARRRRRAFLAAMEDLQDHLGALNDRATAAATLATLAFPAALPSPGKKAHRRLLEQAEDARDTLLDCKRFWRID